MKKFIIYLCSGLVSITAAATIHMIRAEKKGYACLKYWDEYKDEDSISIQIIKTVWGLLIWPYRLNQHIKDIPNLYQKYGLKE